MRIEKVQIKEINPAVYNPRIDLRPNDPDYEKLKKSISTFGLVEPLIWNRRTGNLVGGHQRLKILIEQGAVEVEVSVVDLAPNMEKALNVALNQVRGGGWDEHKLADLLTELGKVPDFDVSVTGFDSPEISEILDRVEEDAKEDGFDLENELEKAGKAVTQKGDLIVLGRHRLLCGDSSNPEDVGRLIGDAKVDLIFSDPPYNVNYYGGNRPSAATRPKDSRMWERIYNDNLSQEEYEAWFKRVLGNVAAHLSPGAPLYLWNGHRQFGPMYTMLIDLGFHVSCVITWAKENFNIGRGDYNQQTEFCLYAWKEDNGAHHWYGPTNESTLWQVKRDPAASYNHPTQKPVALAYRAIKNSSKRGDIVLDMFLGSGTTAISADSLERICYGLEMDQHYCDAIVRRYIAYVGKDKVAPELVAKYLEEGSHVDA